MSTSVATVRNAQASPRRTARIAGVFYLLTFATGLFALLVHTRLAVAAGLIAGACYVVVTLLLYYIFKPASRRVSLLAALVSLAACAIGPLSFAIPALSHVNALVFFGLYCLLIGYLIFKSTFLPAALGAVMMFAGLGWLTFFSPALAKNLSPYNFLPGVIGEGSLTFWLLVTGVNEARWKEQASASTSS
jgi:hypothetical protein